MTAMFMGAGYIGGAWLFVQTIVGNRWHRVAAGFPPVTTFATAMLLATVLHWDIFDASHFTFLLWLILYVVAPPLVLIAWLRNRVTDTGAPEANDPTVSAVARWSLGILGIILLLYALGGFINPAWQIAIWPWPLSPLTSRIMSGWFSLLGVGGMVIARDLRWSAWKVGLQSIGLWHILVLVAAYVRAADFSGGLVNWYLISVMLVLIGMVVLYIFMERLKKERAA